MQNRLVSEKSDLDQIAPEYRSETLLGLNEQYHLVMRDEIIPEQGGESALEFGCGAGSWTEVLCDKYDSVDVVEGSRELIEELESRGFGGKLSTHHSLIEEFQPDSSKKWEHVFMTFLMEHLQEPVEALSGIKTYMEEGGSLFLAVPNANSFHRVLAYRAGLISSTDELSENDHRVGHRRVYTKKLLHQQVLDAGFSIAREWSIGFKPLALRQMEQLSPEVGKALAVSGDLAPAYCAYLGLEAKA